VRKSISPVDVGTSGEAASLRGYRTNLASPPITRASRMKSVRHRGFTGTIDGPCRPVGFGRSPSLISENF
jgi:hypothetical protein